MDFNGVIGGVGKVLKRGCDSDSMVEQSEGEAMLFMWRDPAQQAKFFQRS